MVDKSRSKRAYTLVNVDSQVAEAVLDSIARINGLLAVRYLPIVPRS
jgi:D-3-phosphoglycerate dehydrogenase